METLYQMQPNVATTQASTAAKHVVEVPLLSSTSLDYALSQGGSKRTLQKRRAEIRELLGLPTPEFISLGRRGRFHLETASTFLCLLTATRWPGGRYLESICNAFLQSGLSDIARSSVFSESLNLAIESVKSAIRSSTDDAMISVIVNRTMRNLLVTAEPVREFARAYSNMVEHVVAELPAVKRLTGEVVRFEGPQALLTIDNGEREELRLVDAEYLQQFGIDQADEPFILLQQQWSPDTTVMHYQPAFVEPSVMTEMMTLDEKLKRAEKTLSSN
jgi:hypothetical protein